MERKKEVEKKRKKKTLTLTRMDLRGTKAQFYRITFNKFYSRIMPSMKKNKRGIVRVLALFAPALIIGHIIISNKLPAVSFKLFLVNDDNSFCVLHQEMFLQFVSFERIVLCRLGKVK